MSFTENRSAPGRTSIEIADLYGRVLVRKELAPGDWGKDVTFNLSGIPAGGYFLILDAGDNGRTSQRFVVLR